MTQTPLSVAQTFSGTREGDKLLDKFLNSGGKGLSSAEYAWCSRFMQRTAQQAGYDIGSANDMARSWLKVGTKVDKPEPGDVAVFPRGRNPSLGHVGYVQAVNPDGTISLLSGNDGDQVRTRNYPMGAALGFRRLAPMDGTHPTTQVGAPSGAMIAGQGRESAPKTMHPTTQVGAPSGVMLANYGRQSAPANAPQPAPAPSLSQRPAGPAPVAPHETQWAKGMHQQMLTSTPALQGSLDAPPSKNSPQYKNALIDALGGFF